MKQPGTAQRATSLARKESVQLPSSFFADEMGLAGARTDSFLPEKPRLHSTLFGSRSSSEDSTAGVSVMATSAFGSLTEISTASASASTTSAASIVSASRSSRYVSSALAHMRHVKSPKSFLASACGRASASCLTFSAAPMNSASSESRTGQMPAIRPRLKFTISLSEP